MSGRKLRLKFSKYFDGVVWKMLAIPQHRLLIIESRDENRREVTFSAYDYEKDLFLWQNVTMEESWWIGLLAANENVVVLQIFEDLKYPDQKSVIVLELKTAKMLLRKDNFTFQRLTADAVEGISHEANEQHVIVNFTVTAENDFSQDKISSPVLPFHYLQGEPYFDTISKFVSLHQQQTAVGGAEYMEYDALIVISYYVSGSDGLTNYVLVVRDNGEMLLFEKLGEHLKGLGNETFFALPGYLFFVRNRHELLVYKIEH